MSEPQYKRVLLKISGEALAGDARRGLDFDVIGKVCDVVKQCVEKGIQVAIVVGGGNFWRGMKDGGDRMQRVPGRTIWECWPPPSMHWLWQTALNSGTLRFACRPPLRCVPLRSPISAQKAMPPSGKGPCGDLWLRYRQPLFLHRHRQLPFGLRRSMPT